jgi:BolA protein|tara:strand:- start:809 stop:1078 length:270 start_codon:yes stop_codon:yes gene_type:complete
MNIQLKIKNKLKENFDVSELILIDESYKHKNHKKDTSGGHFKLLIVSNDFKDVSLIKRHQSIYKVLDEMIKVEIHALSIKAVTIQEHNN